MTSKQRHPGLDGRARDKDGEIRHKNGNTRVDTLRGVYGDGFARSRCSNRSPSSLTAFVSWLEIA